MRAHSWQALKNALSFSKIAHYARQGSGSACRSLGELFNLWHTETNPKLQRVEPIDAPKSFRLFDLVALVDSKEKSQGSSLGHALAPSSRYYLARLESVPARLEKASKALRLGIF